jgi:molecular chaperone DnaK (HSP70)
MSDWTICVDFGTAFSKAAAAPTGAWSRFDPSMVRPLMLSGHDPQANAFLLDSAVFVDDDRILFGRAAIARAAELNDKKRMVLRSFKTLLSVSDLDRALNTNAAGSVDPHRVFQMRDLIVLYLAYLLAAVDRAVRADPVLENATIHWRYAAPAWRAGDSAGAHQSVLRLFGEAEAFRVAAGRRLMQTNGVALSFVIDALPKAVASAEPFPMDLIFEATAAASYLSVGLLDSASHLIVVDMGAGTTDIAALARDGARVTELETARVTLKQAGDFMDTIIANRALALAPWARGPEMQGQLWALLMRQMRDIKESLFADGRATLRYDNRALTIAIRDIERDPDFRDFQRALGDAYDESLDIVCGDARALKRSEIDAVAVGGGASAPFIQALIRRKPKRGKVRVTSRNATPKWADAAAFQGNLAPVFSQLAIAIGGALAPDGMVATATGASLPANDRSGIPAGRD